MATKILSPTLRARPMTVVVTIGVLAFLGVTALAGGVSLSVGLAAPPEQWLADVPVVDDWLVPGLILGLAFGIGSLVTAFGVWRRPKWRLLAFVERLTGHHWSLPATILIGAGQLTWILLEVIYLPALSALQVIYGCVGLALVVLPVLPPARAYLNVRAPAT